LISNIKGKARGSEKKASGKERFLRPKGGEKGNTQHREIWGEKKTGGGGNVRGREGGGWGAGWDKKYRKAGTNQPFVAGKKKSYLQKEKGEKGQRRQETSKREGKATLRPGGGGKTKNDSLEDI